MFLVLSSLIIHTDLYLLWNCVLWLVNRLNDNIVFYNVISDLKMFRIAVRSLRIFNSLKQENFSKINPCCTSNLVTVFYNSNNNKRYFSDKKDTGKPDANHFDDEERTEEQQSYDLITSKYFKYDKNEENKRSFEGRLFLYRNIYFICLNIVGTE